MDGIMVVSEPPPNLVASCFFNLDLSNFRSSRVSGRSCSLRGQQSVWMRGVVRGARFQSECADVLRCVVYYYSSGRERCDFVVAVISQVVLFGKGRMESRNAGAGRIRIMALQR